MEESNYYEDILIHDNCGSSINSELVDLEATEICARKTIEHNKFHFTCDMKT